MKTLHREYKGRFTYKNHYDKSLPCFYIMKLEADSGRLHRHSDVFFSKSKVRYALTPKQVQDYLYWVIYQLEIEQVRLQKNIIKWEWFVEKLPGQAI